MKKQMLIGVLSLFLALLTYYITWVLYQPEQRGPYYLKPYREGNYVVGGVMYEDLNISGARAGKYWLSILSSAGVFIVSYAIILHMIGRKFRIGDVLEHSTNTK